MAKLGKRFKAMASKVVEGKSYPVDEALKILKDNSKTKFVESVDVAVRLGIDAKKSDQVVRGSTMMPSGTGKTVRVAVFCPAGEKAEAAKAAGASGYKDMARAPISHVVVFGLPLWLKNPGDAIHHVAPMCPWSGVGCARAHSRVGTGRRGPLLQPGARRLLR